MKIVPPASSSQNDIFDTLREGYAFVAERADHVRIDQDALTALAAALPNRLPENTYDPEHHFLGDAASVAAYILTLDSINFGSGYKAPLVDEGWQLLDDSVYFTVSTRLKALYETQGPVAAAALAEVTIPQFCAIAELDPAKPYSAEFAGLCVQSLRELGTLVAGTFGGDFLALVRAADGSAAKLVERLRRLHSFNDIHLYKGRQIAFYKRAQSAAADLHDAFHRLGQPLFGDIDRLTILADNDVPHVLRVDGVLEYDPALARRIAAGIPLPAGSPEEVEIRACAGHAADRIAKEKGISAITLDRILWHRSVEDARYKETPSHRTLFRFY